MDSNFFFPVTIHQDGVSVVNVATWLPQLPIAPSLTSAVATLISTEGVQPQGMYLYDTNLFRWRYLVPYANVCQAIIDGSAIDLYYQVQAVVEPSNDATIWRNGVLYSGTEILTTPGVAWAVITPPSAGAGTVQSVNGQTPNAQGNVTITAEDNNDASGVSLIADNGATDGTFKFKTLVAGSNITLSADANGNVEIASSGGGAVTSVNGMTGAVVLGVSDISGAAPLASPTFTGIPAAVTAAPGTNTTQLATTAFVTAAIASIPAGGVTSFNSRTGAITLQSSDISGAGGALLASPAFTGTPTSTTPTVGDNSQNIATTAFVTAAVAAGVANTVAVYEPVPTQGQTVFPISFALGSVVEFFRNGGILLSEDYSTSGGVGPIVTNAGVNEDDDIKIIVTTPFAIADTVPTTGGAYTGLVSGITPSAGDNSGNFATTAFVQNAISGISAPVTSVNGQTGAVVLGVADISGAAPLASPVFTGTPQAPTQTAGDNSQNLATTAFVTTAVAGVSYTLPAATTSTLGGVIVGSGLSVTSGTVSANVTTVNGQTGAVVLGVANISGAAPLASPTFTGTPAAPTATAGNSTTQIATTSFVATSYAAPPALGSTTPNAVSATTLSATGTVSGAGFTNLLAPYAPLASPTLTGTPAVPTATAGTNTTQIASTAFTYVAAQGAASVALTNANVTLTAAQYSVPVVTFTGALTGNIVVTVPTTGKWTFLNITTGAFTVTVSNGTGATALVAQSTTAGTSLVSNATEGVIPTSATGSSGVTSFNSRTGVVTLQASDVTGVGGALLASPAFTGIPTVPTAMTLTNTTQAASTAFVLQTFQRSWGTVPLSGITGGTYNLATLGSGCSVVYTVTGGSVTGISSIAAGGTGFAVGDILTLAAGNIDCVVHVTGVSGGAVTTVAILYGGSNYTAGTASIVQVPAAELAYNLTGTLTSNALFVVPAPGYLYGGSRGVINNNTTGGFTVTFKLTNGAGGTIGTGVVIPQGTNNSASTFIYGDGTNDIWPVTPLSAYATTASVSATYAPLASPTFTGVPAAPTATAGTNTTQLATTAFVTAAVSAVTTGFAPIASPTFTGTPAAPTATSGTDTTQLATTAFVYNATQATGSVALTNANVTLTAAQYGSAIIDFTGTLTANVVVTFPATGQWTLFNNTTGAFTVTVSNGSGATFAVPQGATTEAISSGSTGMLPSSSASPVRFQSPAYSYSVSALGSVSGTQTLNLGTATEFTMTITGATTLAFTNTLLTGTSEVVYIRFTNAGSAAITWPSGAQFVGGTAPTFTASGIDLIGVKYDTTSSTYFVFVIGLNMQV